MKKRTTVLILVFALVASASIFAVGVRHAMNEKIMMRVSEDEPLFDATKWFANGMYERIPLRDEDRAYYPEGTQYVDTSMRRIFPPSFTDEQVEILQMRIVRALKEESVAADFRQTVPSSVDDLGLGSSFDPRPQIVYSTSGFRDYGDGEPKMIPIDHYTFYTLLEGKRFYVYIDRNGETGDIAFAYRAHSSLFPADEEERRFQELQSKADLRSRLDAPGWKKRSGEPCPWPGTWECLELPVGKQTFAHNMPFPQIDGQDVTWRFAPQVI
ncbi:hypothetical protein G3O00_20195 [Burkholderia sp. Ac-20384]|uniref:hypothetical protein n=1 Tax=Burkholderia sp. Ac-20384 TaxID=2703902 RepID=UPI0019826550|nr:hypothetical protein [Burkholderia sp. Ac-20384]MBN3825931.1 hypothetical protein [Burkholderia sp. Ac-20384]